eukprot:3565233-Pleurochrysis_carterae.AAC.1
MPVRFPRKRAPVYQRESLRACACIHAEARACVLLCVCHTLGCACTVRSLLSACEGAMERL